MDADQVLAFRLARSGLADRDAVSLTEAAACPASDFSRDAALLALSARWHGVTREAYDAAADGADGMVLAHVIRGAIHALAPGDFALLGKALVATDDDDLAAQLGDQAMKLTKAAAIAPTDAVEEVAEATRDSLASGRKLTKDELHDELRARVQDDLMPWCKGCGSHHVAPMLWRFGGVKAGARLDSRRRYLMGRPGKAPAATDAVGFYLRFYGPGTPSEFAEWAGLAKSHGKRLWEEAEGELGLEEVAVGKKRGWIPSADAVELDAPPEASGACLIPPGDPYLQKPNRPLLAPDADLRKRLFRPVASPGAVLKDGRLVGLWRVKAKGKKAEFSVEKTGRVAKGDLEAEAQRIADLRGAADLTLSVS